MAITWRTLNQPTLAGVGLLMNGAQQGLNNGFQALHNVLDQRNKTDASNWQVEKGNNTADYLNAVQDIKDPAQLADPQTQANLAALRQQFGYKIDANAIRGADEKRANDLQVQATNNLKFGDLNQEHDQRPLVEEFYRMKNAGDFKGAQALLDANGFLDEGKLADSLKSGLYAANNETRNVAQEGRSAASFDLNQKVQRANLDYTTTQRDILKDERSRTLAGDALTNQSVNDYLSNRAASAAKANEIAAANGVPIVDGIPDMSGISDEKQAEIGQKLQDAGVDLLNSPTASRNALAAQLRANHYPESKIAAAVSGFDAAITSNNTLAPQDQAEVDNQLAKIKLGEETSTAQEQKTFGEKQAKNVFLKGVTDPGLGVDDIVKTLKSNEFDPLFAKGTNRDDAITSAVGLINKGVEVDGVHYDVPPALLKAGMAIGANDWWNPGKGIENAIKDLIKTNPEAYRDSVGALKEHTDEMTKIKTDSMKRKLRIEAQYRSKNGIAYDPTKLTESTVKGRN